MRCNENLFAEPPVFGVDHQVTDFPAFIVDDEVLDVADGLVAALDVVSTDLAGAPEMNIAGRFVGMLGRLLIPLAYGEQAWVSARPPRFQVSPVVGIAIVTVVIPLVLSGNRLMDVDARAVLDLVPRQSQAEGVGCPVDLTKEDGRDEHARWTRRTCGLDDEIANDPTLVVQQKIHHAPDVAVSRCHSVPFEVFQTSQHGFLVLL